MLLNPYIAGNPLRDKNAFFGREDALREVLQMLNHPDEKALVMYGQRRIGKTTILLQINERLTAGSNFTPVYFDLQDRASSTLVGILYKLAQSIAHCLGKPLPPADKFDEEGIYFRKEFLPEMIKLAAPGGLVILFDEFDVIDSPQNNQTAQSFFPYLRSCIAELQKTKFVFVIGRRPEELNIQALAAFKGIRATRVSLLDRKSTISLIRQSEVKKSLLWSDEAVEQMWKWTQGHAYFTQLLCSVIWESLQENSTGKIPTVSASHVNLAIQDALKHGANAFHWIWDGLPPAERVVMAAIAEAKEDVISQDQIEEILNRSGVSFVARQLKVAPMTLVDWELLHPVDENYRFAVPLLRHWVKINRPLPRVKEELDNIEPLARNLFNAGQGFYNLGKIEAAVDALRQALSTNPNHLKSRQLLGRILLEKGTPESIGEAVKILEEAYSYDKVATEADLIKTLLVFAETKENEDEKLKVYDRILELQPAQPVAVERRTYIWRTKGEAALAKGDILSAIRFFEEAGDQKKVDTIRQNEKHKLHDAAEAALQQNNLQRALELFELAGETSRVQYVKELIEKKWMDEHIGKALQAEKEEAWGQAVQSYKSIVARYPKHERALQLLKKAEQQSQLAEEYKQALEYMNSSHVDQAQALLGKILAVDPEYKEAARYLYESIYGPPRKSSILTRVVALITVVVSLMWGAFTTVWFLDDKSVNVFGGDVMAPIIIVGLLWVVCILLTVPLAIVLFRDQKPTAMKKRKN